MMLGNGRAVSGGVSGGVGNLRTGAPVQMMGSLSPSGRGLGAASSYQIRDDKFANIQSELRRLGFTSAECTQTRNSDGTYTRQCRLNTDRPWLETAVWEDQAIAGNIIALGAFAAELLRQSYATGDEAWVGEPLKTEFNWYKNAGGADKQIADQQFAYEAKRYRDNAAAQRAAEAAMPNLTTVTPGASPFASGSFAPLEWDMVEQLKKTDPAAAAANIAATLAVAGADGTGQNPLPTASVYQAAVIAQQQVQLGQSIDNAVQVALNQVRAPSATSGDSWIPGVSNTIVMAGAAVVVLMMMKK